MENILAHISEIAIIGIGIIIRAVEKRIIKKKEQQKRSGNY